MISLASVQQAKRALAAPPACTAAGHAIKVTIQARGVVVRWTLMLKGAHLAR
jgi:hypothetical protein